MIADYNQLFPTQSLIEEEEQVPSDDEVKLNPAQMIKQKHDLIKKIFKQ